MLCGEPRGTPLRRRANQASMSRPGRRSGLGASGARTPTFAVPFAFEYSIVLVPACL